MTTTQNKISTVTNNNGRTFELRIIEVGDNYGRNNCLTHDDPNAFGAMVEFWDTTHNQFVSRYYIKTLQDRDQDYGLCLDGGVPVWSIDAAAMQTVHKFIEGWVK
jgi:hypothetical protein